MRMLPLAACLCPLAIGAVDLASGLLLGTAVAVCLSFTVAGEALLRPYTAAALCLPLRFLLCGLAVFVYRLIVVLSFYPLAHDIFSLSLAGVVAAVILMTTGDDGADTGWKFRLQQCLAAIGWLAVLGCARGLCAYGSWQVTPGVSPLTGPLPLLASPSGVLLLSAVLLASARLIYDLRARQGGKSQADDPP